MKKIKSKDLSDLGGMVFSTNPEFEYDAEAEEVDSVENHLQRLVVYTDKKHRKGKVVTLIDGFRGSENDLQQMAKKLKGICGAGGSAKDGTILVQGDFKNRIADYLRNEGCHVKISG